MNINELIRNFYNCQGKLDIKAILEEHAKSKDYDPYRDDQDLRVLIIKNIKDNDDHSLIKNCYKILKFNTFDFESHALISNAASKLNKIKIAELHNVIASSLLENIFQSGNGKDYTTAYTIFFPKDEMAVFNYLRKYPESRVNHEKNGRCFDIYTFPDKESVFFDISIPFFHVANKFSSLDK